MHLPEAPERLLQLARPRGLQAKPRRVQQLVTAVLADQHSAGPGSAATFTASASAPVDPSAPAGRMRSVGRDDQASSGVHESDARDVAGHVGQRRSDALDSRKAATSGGGRFSSSSRRPLRRPPRLSLLHGVPWRSGRSAGVRGRMGCPRLRPTFRSKLAVSRPSAMQRRSDSIAHGLSDTLACRRNRAAIVAVGSKSSSRKSAMSRP